MDLKTAFRTVALAVASIVLANATTVHAQCAGACVLFDDFDYTSVIRDAPGSLLGQNEWRAGLEEITGTRNERAWYWVNWAEPDYRDESIGEFIRLPEPGVLQIRLPAGYSQAQRAPALLTGITVRTGVFAARVRFHPLGTQANLQQAFWTVSPVVWSESDQAEQRRAELDLEWNNWFAGGRRSDRMHVTNHGYSGNGPQRAQGVEMECFFTSSDADGRSCRDALSGTWAVLYMAFDGTSVRYALASDLGPSGSGVSNAARGGASWSEPLRIDSPLPAWPSDQLAAVFSQHLRSDVRLTRDLTMEVDWFYYKDRTDAAIDEVIADVDALREKGISRLNTTGRPTHAPAPTIAPYSAVISGPAALEGGETGTWRVHHSLRGTHFYYRWHTRVRAAAGSRGTWSDAEGNAPSFTAALPSGSCDASGLDVRVTVTDRWTRHRTYRILSVERTDCVP